MRSRGVMHVGDHNVNEGCRDADCHDSSSSTEPAPLPFIHQELQMPPERAFWPQEESHETIGQQRHVLHYLFPPAERKNLNALSPKKKLSSDPLVLPRGVEEELLANN